MKIVNIIQSTLNLVEKCTEQRQQILQKMNLKKKSKSILSAIEKLVFNSEYDDYLMLVLMDDNINKNMDIISTDDVKLLI